jgi:hypothetical protein
MLLQEPLWEKENARIFTTVAKDASWDTAMMECDGPGERDDEADPYLRLRQIVFI